MVLAARSRAGRLTERGDVASCAGSRIGAVVDTVVFLSLAGFPLAGTATQVIVKVGVTTVFVLAVRGIVALRSQPVLTEGA